MLTIRSHSNDEGDSSDAKAETTRPQIPHISVHMDGETHEVPMRNKNRGNGEVPRPKSSIASR